jgi:hypothetical protein
VLLNSALFPSNAALVILGLQQDCFVVLLLLLVLEISLYVFLGEGEDGSGMRLVFSNPYYGEI